MIDVFIETDTHGRYNVAFLVRLILFPPDKESDLILHKNRLRSESEIDH